MGNTLIDRQALEQVVDALLAQKYPGQPAETLTEVRENAIASLDDAIGKSIVDGMNGEQLAKYRSLLETEQEDSTVFENFFRENNIDLEANIKNAVGAFGQAFLGGANV